MENIDLSLIEKVTEDSEGRDNRDEIPVILEHLGSPLELVGLIHELQVQLAAKHSLLILLCFIKVRLGGSHF